MGNHNKKAKHKHPRFTKHHPHDNSVKQPPTSKVMELLTKHKDSVINNSVNAVLTSLLALSFTQCIANELGSTGLNQVLKQEELVKLSKVLLSPASGTLQTINKTSNLDLSDNITKAMLATIITQGSILLKESGAVDDVQFFLIHTSLRTLLDLYYNTNTMVNLPKTLAQTLTSNTATSVLNISFPYLQTYIQPILATTALASKEIGNQLSETIANNINFENFTKITAIANLTQAQI